MDEQNIIEMQKKALFARYNSIDSAVTYINERRYHFVERDIQEACIQIKLPKEFIDLPPMIAKRKYPSEERPKAILSSTDTSINFAFSLLAGATIDEAGLVTVRNAALDAMKKLNPHFAYLDAGVSYYGDKQHRTCSWYEFCNPTLDSESYAFNAFMCSNKKLLHYIFNCPKSDYEHWRPIVFMTIQTIREKTTL